jgi:hypothetical protein
MKPELSQAERRSAIFRRAGLTLYGPRYRSELARLLLVSPRVIRRWEATQAPIPDNVLGEVFEAIKEKGHMVNFLLEAFLKELIKHK